MKDLIPIENEKNDAFSRILDFYKSPAEKPLTADDERILARWIHCDVLIRGRKHKRTEIISEIVGKFGVSKYTAENDIAETHSLFGQVRALSKQYLLALGIEDIDLQIERTKTDKSLALMLPKLYMERTRMINSLPDDVPKTPTAPTIIHIGSLTINNNNDKPKITIEEAKERWKLKKAAREKKDYIDHEDV